MNTRLAVMLLPMMLVLNACSLIKPTINPQIDTYTLSPELNSDVTPSEPATLLVAFAPIRGMRSLMTTDIIYRNSDYGFDSYAYSRWSDSPVKLLSSYLQQTLASKQQLANVIPYDVGAKATLLLRGELVDFSHHVQDSSTSLAVATVHFYLIDVQTKSVVANSMFSVQGQANPKNAKGATAALNRASSQIAEQLNTWLTKQLSMQQKR